MAAPVKTYDFPSTRVQSAVSMAARDGSDPAKLVRARRTMMQAVETTICRKRGLIQSPPETRGDPGFVMPFYNRISR